MAGFKSGDATLLQNDDLIADSSNLEEVTVLIDSTAQDAGNPESANVLRAGLVLGKITASSKYKEFDSAAIDGTQNEEDVVILAHEVREGDTDAFTSDKVAMAYYSGTFFAAKILGDGGLVWADVQRLRRR